MRESGFESSLRTISMNCGMTSLGRPKGGTRTASSAKGRRPRNPHWEGCDSESSELGHALPLGVYCFRQYAKSRG
jgi:hypothetical protein